MSTTITATYTEASETTTRSLTIDHELSERCAQLVGLGLIAELELDYVDLSINVNVHHDRADAFTSPRANEPNTPTISFGDTIEVIKQGFANDPPIGYRAKVARTWTTECGSYVYIPWNGKPDYEMRACEVKIVDEHDRTSLLSDAAERYDRWAMDLLGLDGSVEQHGRENLRKQITERMREAEDVRADLDDLADDLDRHANSCRTLLPLSSHSEIDYARIGGKEQGYAHSAELVRACITRRCARVQLVLKRQSDAQPKWGTPEVQPDGTKVYSTPGLTVLEHPAAYAGDFPSWTCTTAELKRHRIEFTCAPQNYNIELSINGRPIAPFGITTPAPTLTQLRDAAVQNIEARGIPVRIIDECTIEVEAYLVDDESGDADGDEPQCVRIYAAPDTAAVEDSNEAARLAAPRKLWRKDKAIANVAKRKPSVRWDWHD